MAYERHVADFNSDVEAATQKIYENAACLHSNSTQHNYET